MSPDASGSVYFRSTFGGILGEAGSATEAREFLRPQQAIHLLEIPTNLLSSGEREGTQGSQSPHLARISAPKMCASSQGRDNGQTDTSYQKQHDSRCMRHTE